MIMKGRRITLKCIKLLTVIGILSAFSWIFGGQAAHAVPGWTSPNSYRLLLTVNPRISYRRNSPASVNINFPQTLANMGAAGVFDESTVEVIAYNAAGVPKVFDSSRTGYEQYLLPCRIDKYYKASYVTLNFVLPDQTYTQYAVYFDTKESGNGKPSRYHGLVGDGDFFTEGYERREINACKFDSFADFDGDGDLDLFKGGVEPFIWCYENVGGNRYEDRGKLTNGGQPWTLTSDGGRAWLVVDLNDWDGDGDQDVFASFSVSSDAGNIVIYENTAPPGGTPAFTRRGNLVSKTGVSLGSGWFSAPTIVDWDGDGKKDVIVVKDYQIEVHRNIGTSNSLSNIQLDDGFYVKANGAEIVVFAGRCDLADIDSDGDLDLMTGTQDGHVFWFKNVGTRSNPVFTAGRLIAFYEFMDAHSSVKIHDFDGDGLLDFVVGRFWERTHFGEQPRVYGRMYKNIGTATAPKFQARDAYNGSPYTEKFQMCDAVRQNGVKSIDWNGDGRTDLIASDTDGFVWFFQNITNHLFPVFAPGVKLMSNGQAVRVYAEGNWGGYARCDVVDWDNDTDKDLLVADGRGWLTLYKNIGTATNPVLDTGTRVAAHGYPIDGTGRCTVLVTDWDGDNKKDMIFGMTGEGTSEYYDWESTGGDPSGDFGFLFYKNTGTDIAPSFANQPTWVKAGSTIITYGVRPNLGSFVDWDNDGKKDFIAAEFENNIRFHKNTKVGTGAPQFSSATGVYLINPTVSMMLSGADALDWNRDNDVDIVTGQGHGGSGLRFFERDYIIDKLNSTLPIVSSGASGQGVGVLDAKLTRNGLPVDLPQGIVTASFTNYFYVQSTKGYSGMRVEKAAHGLLVGQNASVSGSVTTNPDGERYVAATSAVPNGSGEIRELALSNKALGGKDLNYDSVYGSGQMGITNGIGLNNIALLVKTLGKCIANLSDTGDYYGNRYLFIDDGSGVTSWYRAIGGSYVEVNGVMVEVDDDTIAVDDYVIARGVSSIEYVNGVYQSKILVRPDMGDIIKM
ncbi:MAG: VCBS repeat-containing protein [Armatimonadota bacterium]|nr:VCBS repeat-containing protein [Armatimonadota bacterium]